MEEYCPRCEQDVEIGKMWVPTQCPKCGLEGNWDEGYDRETHDTWPIFSWEDFIPEGLDKN